MLGKPVTDFSAACTGGTCRLKDERGTKLVLCFYPHNTNRSRKVRGIERSTFVIDETACWRANGAG